MKKLVSFIGILGVFICWNTRGYAGDLYVPGSYPTIQEAIDAATTGDTVWVADGTGHIRAQGIKT